MDYRVGGTEVSSKGKIIKDLFLEKVDIASSGLSKREWNELMNAFDIKKNYNINMQQNISFHQIEILA